METKVISGKLDYLEKGMANYGKMLYGSKRIYREFSFVEASNITQQQKARKALYQN